MSRLGYSPFLSSVQRPHIFFRRDSSSTRSRSSFVRKFAFQSILSFLSDCGRCASAQGPVLALQGTRARCWNFALSLQHGFPSVHLLSTCSGLTLHTSVASFPTSLSHATPRNRVWPAGELLKSRATNSTVHPSKCVSKVPLTSSVALGIGLLIQTRNESLSHFLR